MQTSASQFLLWICLGENVIIITILIVVTAHAPMLTNSTKLPTISRKLRHFLTNFLTTYSTKICNVCFSGVVQDKSK